MKLSIHTDVMGNLSFTDMLDKCVALGLEGVEMTGGGWSKGPHFRADQLLADKGLLKRKLKETARTSAIERGKADVDGLLELGEVTDVANRRGTTSRWRGSRPAMVEGVLPCRPMMGYDDRVSLEMEDFTMSTRPVSKLRSMP